MTTNHETRELTHEERSLARWMLEHGSPAAQAFLDQLVVAEATVERCPCGCASFNFKVPGYPTSRGIGEVVGDYLFGEADCLSGAFIFECDGALGGVEVYGFVGDAPRVLPKPEDLRPFLEG